MMDKKNLLRRRDFLRLTAFSSVSYLLFTGQKCNENKEDDTPPPPPEPEPVYELTDGITMYDNFDGGGALQSFNNQHLAVAGSLSSALWSGSFDVVENPSNIAAVVNEHGQRVEYGWESIQVQELITYLQDNPRPIDRFERTVLQGLLNEQGSKLVSFIEEKNVEKQVKIIQYILNRRDVLFNEQGRKIIKAVSRVTSANLSPDEYQGLIRQGLDENELAVLSNMIIEKRMYDNIKNSPFRRAIDGGRNILKTGIGLRPELREIKYVFDKDGNLIEATPHVPGQPYHGSKQLRWIDSNGQVRALAQPQYMHTQAGSGYVVKMTHDGGGSTRLRLTNPQDIEFKDYKSFVADVFLSSAAPSDDFQIGIDYHTSFAEQGGGSWFCQIGVKKDASGARDANIFAFCNNKNTSYQYWNTLREANFDTWYRIRMDIVTNEDENGKDLKDNELRIDFYINGKLSDSEIPEDSALLLNPDKTDFGPSRSIDMWQPQGGKEGIAFVDNVKAVYRNRIS